MKFNLSKLNPGTWFWFDEKNPDNGGVCLRVVSRKKMEEIKEATMTITYEYRSGQRYENRDVDRQAWERMLWDYVIVDWKNLINDDGSKILCDADNKYKLMSEHPGFAAFVQDKLDELNTHTLDQQEDVEKN
jgi:hypothetical protein